LSCLRQWSTFSGNMNLAIKNAAFAAGMVLVVAWSLWALGSKAAEKAVVLPPPVQDLPLAKGRQSVVLAGGCFWGVQAVFQHTRGVLGAVSGYAGGDAASAKYELVSSGQTRHAEAVQVTYDPEQVSLGKLLQIFFSVAHDPTQLDRQGPDAGPQYRSAVFYTDAQQKQVVESYVAQLGAAKVFPKKIVTQVAPLAGFYKAEAYHQDYATRNPHQPYILTFDRPKIENLKALMPQQFRNEPVLVSPGRGS
jgi:peptide-methionine (S)-S-oxide reductase